jgi:hypothetical protein
VITAINKVGGFKPVVTMKTQPAEPVAVVPAPQVTAPVAAPVSMEFEGKEPAPAIDTSKVEPVKAEPKVEPVKVVEAAPIIKAKPSTDDSLAVDAMLRRRKQNS